MLATHENKGFSLLDLLIVLMILGILGVFLAPQLHSTLNEARLNEARLNEATRELVSGLHYAQSLAVIHQRPFGLAANLTENWFRVFDHRFRTDASPHHTEIPPVDGYGVVLNPVDKKWYMLDFDTAHQYEGVRIDSAPASGGMISFYSDGHSPVADSVFVLVFAGEQRTITVDGITGRISVN